MSSAENSRAVSQADSSEARFAAIVEELLGEPGVTPPDNRSGTSRGFGSNALKVNSKIVAFLSDGRLVVKLPRQRVEALCASGDGQRWDPGHGRLMKEWLALDPESNQNWLTLAKEALAFVGARS
jgi:hypothetical protein